MKNKEIIVLDQEIHINKDDYFSLTDIAKYKNPEDPRFVIQNWMRRIDTIQYMGLLGCNFYLDRKKKKMYNIYNGVCVPF